MADENAVYCDSKETADGEEPPTSKPGAKRRASRAGTRSVASLTPEQLARKRANDREAQRSIRQRTKTHIEELEQRIRDLSQDQDARNFEQIKRRNAELEEELRRLSELLGRSEANMGSSPDLNPSSFGSRYSMDIHEEPHPLAFVPSWGTQQIEGPGSPYLSPPTSSAGDLLSSFASDHSGLPSGLSEPGSARSEAFNEENLTSPPTVHAPITSRGAPPARPQFGRSQSYPHGRFGLPSSSLPMGMSGIVNGLGPSPLASQSSSSLNRPLMMSGSGIHHSVPPTSHPLTLNQRMDPAGQQQRNVAAYEVPRLVVNRPAWELPLRLLPPTGPVEVILLRLIQSQRSIATTENALGSQIIGPYHPDLKPIVSPEMPRDMHPVPYTISDLFKRLEYVSFAEKAAALLILYRLVQWQILPTKETYQNMPDWARPRPSALTTAHPLWVSFLIWGGLRDVVIGDQQKYATEELMNLYQSNVTVNWPFGDEEILVLVGEEVRVTDAFKHHIDTLASWSLGEPFYRRYPELRDVCR